MLQGNKLPSERERKMLELHKLLRKINRIMDKVNKVVLTNPFIKLRIQYIYR